MATIREIGMNEMSFTPSLWGPLSSRYLPHGERTRTGRSHPAVKLPSRSGEHHFHSLFIGQSSDHSVFKAGRKEPLYSGKTGEPDLFMDVRLVALQLSHYISITNMGLLLLEFLSMYLVTFHPPTSPGGRHSHPFQATRLSFLKSPRREEVRVQELQSLWESWGGRRPPKCFVPIF